MRRIGRVCIFRATGLVRCECRCLVPLVHVALSLPWIIASGGSHLAAIASPPGPRKDTGR